MSRWLSQVNNLLEKLDGTVETAVEEQLVRAEEEGLIAGQGKDAVDSILAKRGLDVSADTVSDDEVGGEVDDDDDEEEEVEFSEETVEFPRDDAVSQTKEAEETREALFVPSPITVPTEADEQQEAAAPGDGEEVSEAEPDPFSTNSSEIADENSATQEDRQDPNESIKEVPQSDNDGAGETEVSENEDVDAELEPPIKAGTVDAKAEASASTVAESPVSGQREELPSSKQKSPTPPPPPPPRPPQPVTRAAPPPPPPTPKPAGTPVARGLPPSPPKPPTARGVSEKDYKKALADARAAQKEARTLRRHVVSLNTELESAESEIEAQRSELERAGDRMAKDRQRAKEEKERLTKQHKEEIKLKQQQHDKAVSDWKSRHDKVVSDSRVELKHLEARRMQEGGDWNKEMEGALQRESESRQKIAMLQDEKETLLSQLETMQTQQEATERRLDSLQQTADNAFLREREAEDKLDAALSLHARQLGQRQARESELERTIADLGAALVAARNKAQNNESFTGDTNSAVSVMNYKEEWAKSQDELDAVRAQLESEKQRCHTMKKELKDMSKERTQDLAAARSKQLEHDRKVADLSSQISRLQKAVSRRESSEESSTDMMGDDKARELMELSEQVVRQQERLGSSKTEISTLRSRLQAALNRAETAEAAQAAAENALEGYDIESAENGGSRGLRRRGGRRKKPESVRSALMLNGSQNRNVERVGKAIDVLDSFSMQTGKFLRYNPFARGGFILYLLLLHAWTLVIIVFHAHNSEHLHAGVHGPHALMLPSDVIMQQHRQQLANQLQKAPDTQPMKPETEVSVAGTDKNPDDAASGGGLVENEVKETEQLVNEELHEAAEKPAMN